MDARVSAACSLSIVMPCLNEADGIVAALGALAPLRQRGVEVIVADGGSTDGTATLAREGADRVVDAPRGRAAQMNAGARLARGRILLFLHADTRLPQDADFLVERRLASSGKSWGRFDVHIYGRHPFLPVIAAATNLRSRWSGIATGDQALFIERERFEQVGGFPEIALMEDVALSATLRRAQSPLCLREKVITSGRRWEKHGVTRTVLLMWRLRLAYWLGADPSALALRYVSHR